MTAQNDRQRARWAGRSPSPPLDRDGGDWIGRPNQSVQGREAGWPRRVGSRALPGHPGAPGQWAGWPAFLSLAPRGQATPPSPAGPTVCILSGTGGQALLGGVWKNEVCALWGGTEFQPWEALAGPCMALSSWAGQAGAGGQLGELGSSSTREQAPHPSAYFLWSHVQIVG